MNQKELLKLSAVCYLLSSASVMPMAAGDITGKNGSTLVAALSAVSFWLFLIIAIRAQLILRKKQKPYRGKRHFKDKLLTPPAVYFEAGFILAFATLLVLSGLHINGFVFYFVLFLTLSCFELALLTMGKFKSENGRIAFVTYSKKHRSNIIMRNNRSY